MLTNNDGRNDLLIIQLPAYHTSIFSQEHTNRTIIELSMNISVEVSTGEFLDKITILEIKSERIKDADKLININKELEILKKTWAESPASQTDISTLLAELKAINEALWDIEDRIRIKESEAAFDEEFIELSRSVYITNDRRSVVKRQLNQALGSNLMEEKSYADYQRK